MPRRRFWSADEDAVIESVYPPGGPSACSEILGRTENACANRARRIGVSARVGHNRLSNRWTTGQERVCVKLLSEMCRATGHSPLGVLHHLETLVRCARVREGKS